MTSAEPSVVAAAPVPPIPNASKILSNHERRLMQAIRLEETRRLDLQLRRFDGIFDLAILSMSFLYGLGALNVLATLRSQPDLAFSWLEVITAGNAILLAGFSVSSAYEYQAWDMPRTCLHLIRDFYDSQRGNGQNIQCQVTGKYVQDNNLSVKFWLKIFPKELERAKMDNGAYYFSQNQQNTVIDWLKALINIRSGDGFLLTFGESWVRQFYLKRRGFSTYALGLYTLVVVDLFLGHSIGVIDEGTLIDFFIGATVFLALFTIVVIQQESEKGPRR